MRENLQTGLSRGRRSRNKVSVGEPAEGSFQQQTTQKLSYTEFYSFELTGALRYSGAVFNVALSAFLLNRVAASASFFFSFSNQPLDLDTNVTSAKRIKQNTPFNDGPLGSRNDEERGKMRKCSMNCRI